MLTEKDKKKAIEYATVDTIVSGKRKGFAIVNPNMQLAYENACRVKNEEIIPIIKKAITDLGHTTVNDGDLLVWIRDNI